jgi:hypothetical protein
MTNAERKKAKRDAENAKRYSNNSKKLEDIRFKRMQEQKDKESLNMDSSRKLVLQKLKEKKQWAIIW